MNPMHLVMVVSLVFMSCAAESDSEDEPVRVFSEVVDAGMVTQWPSDAGTYIFRFPIPAERADFTVVGIYLADVVNAEVLDLALLRRAGVGSVPVTDGDWPGRGFETMFARGSDPVRIGDLGGTLAVGMLLTVTDPRKNLFVGNVSIDYLVDDEPDTWTLPYLFGVCVDDSEVACRGKLQP